MQKLYLDTGDYDDTNGLSQMADIFIWIGAKQPAGLTYDFDDGVVVFTIPDNSSDGVEMRLRFPDLMTDHPWLKAVEEDDEEDEDDVDDGIWSKLITLGKEVRGIKEYFEGNEEVEIIKTKVIRR